jgi:hypothetical protein
MFCFVFSFGAACVTSVFALATATNFPEGLAGTQTIFGVDAFYLHKNL